MRIVSWNVAKRRNCDGQVAALLALKPDVVVLQEVMERTWPSLRAGLDRAGLNYAASGRELAAIADPSRQLACFVAIVSRWALLPGCPAAVPDPGAVACVRIEPPGEAFEVVGAHIPTVGRPDRWIKVETQEGLVARLKEATLPAIVCGDFNSPRGEAADGEIVPFATARGGRALAAERALVGRTNGAGMVDVFRAVHGYERDAASWYWKNRGRTGGFRLDHIFASKEVRVSRCDYDHVCRDIGLSDHSAIYADFELECANSGMPDSTTASAFSSEAP